MFLEAVGLTVLTETPVMCLGFRKDVKNVGFIRFVVNCILVNAITNIVLNVLLLVIRSGVSMNYSTYVWIFTVLEMTVYFAECFMYRFAFGQKVNNIRIYLVVFLANAVSLLAGFLIF